MQNFNVDISSPGGPLVFYAMQADSLSRFFTLTITDNGAAWDPPSGALWSVRFGAPQMPSGWYDTIEDATQKTHQALNVATGTQTVATVEIAEQALSSPGQNILCVLVTDAAGYQIASWPIILSIQTVPGLAAPQVTDYYNLLAGQVAQVLQNAQAAAQSAADAQEYAQQAQQVSQGAVGYYETEAALETAHPTGEAGNWAIVGDSDTIYVWDTDTSAWVDTGSNVDLSQYYTKTQSDAKYALGTSGVANSAAKLQTPVKIGDADFDGSAPVTLGQMGALSSAAPAALSPVTPADATYVKNVTGGYAKLGQIVFVSVAGQTAQAISGGSISVASGLPAPAAALMQGTGFKMVPLPAYGLHCSGGGISAGGSLAITRAPGETYPANEDFFISGFYYAEA